MNGRRAGKRALAVAGAMLLGMCGTGCRQEVSHGYLASLFSVSGLEADEGAEDAAVALLDEIEAVAGASVEGSDPDRFNGADAGESVEMNGHTVRMLLFCAGQRRNNGGELFSPAMYAYSELWGFPDGTMRVPSREEIDAVRGTAESFDDFDEIGISGTTVTKPRQQTRLDLGGVAKGYALDCIGKLLTESHGAERGVIGLGGSLLLLGTRADGEPYRIGIADPRAEEHAPSRYAAIVALPEGFVSTSSDAERYFVEDGVRYCHILDPRTGCPAESDLVSVTVFVPRQDDDTLAGALSDFWSTALYVAGREQALSVCAELADRYPGFGYFLLGRDGRYDTNLSVLSPDADSGVWSGYAPR